MRNLKRRHLITSIAFTVVAGGACFYLFSAYGPILKNWNTDLSFLLLPLLGYFLLRLLSRLCGGQVQSFRGQVAANVLNAGWRDCGRAGGGGSAVLDCG